MSAGLRRVAARLALCLACLGGAGCASLPPGTIASAADPWEAWNRKVFAFNEAVDEAVLRPVAQAYRDVVPELLRTGVSNVFGNIGDVWSAANHLLQGKIGSGVEMGLRVLVNSTMGLGGLLDPATEMRLTRRSEDFGQTLAVWGFGSGPYLVLPLLGPSTVRDTTGLPLDMYATSTARVASDYTEWLAALRLVNVRSELLATTGLLQQVSLDKYTFVRDGYLARRIDQVYDGAPPLEKFEDDPGDAPPKGK